MTNSRMNRRMNRKMNAQNLAGRKAMETLRKGIFQTVSLSAAVLLLTAAPVYATEASGSGNTTATEVTTATTVIGAENAQNFAFADAGIDPLAADSLTTKYDYDDDEGQFVYDVEFIADGAEYEYEIQAYDGSVLEKSIEYYTLENTLRTSTDLTGSITLEEAKEIALTDAGLTGDSVENAGMDTAGTGTTQTEATDADSTGTEDQDADSAETQPETPSAETEAVTVTFIKEKLDEDDGLSVYEIEFYTDTMKYEYEISAVTGAILSVSMKVRTANNTADGGSVTSASYGTDSTGTDSSTTDSGSASSSSSSRTDSSNSDSSGSSNASGNSGSTGSTSSYISVDEAKEIALAYAGLSASDVTFKKAKLDNEHGVMIYELEFYQGNIEYECEINATTGTVIEFEKDHDHD